MASCLTRRAMALASAAGASLLVLGCKEEDPSCNDSPDLTAANQAARNALAYQDRAADPSQACRLCRQFIAGDGCGRCKLMPGPTHPMGTCKIFTGT